MNSLPHTSPLIAELRKPVIQGKTSSEEWRRIQLKRFGEMIEINENAVLKALHKDLGKPNTEAFFELIALRQELKLAQQCLKTWIRARKVNVPLSLQPGNASVVPEPLGCVLIIGPWNYPFSLTLQPLVGAFAAGNTAVLKPSEHAPHVSGLIKKLIQRYFQPNIVQVIEGDGNIAV